MEQIVLASSSLKVNLLLQHLMRKEKKNLNLSLRYGSTALSTDTADFTL